MKRTRYLIAALIVLVLAGGARTSSAQDDRPGSTSAEFLRIGVSPRAAGMAGAYMAMVEGPEAGHYNAAALPWQSDGLHVALNHLEWFAHINHEFIGLSRNVSGFGTFGASVTALYTDPMKVRTPLQQDGTGETFYATNFRASLSYARWLTDRVTFGGTVSYIRISLYDDFAEQAVAFDIATAYQSDFRDFRFGVKIGNVGTEMTFVNEGYPLPTIFVFGARINAVDLGSQRVMAAGSVTKPNDGQPQIQVGAEYVYADALFLRGGYHINYSTAGPAFGGGLRFDVGGMHLGADYAYSSYDLLGVAHRFGLSFVL